MKFDNIPELTNYAHDLSKNLSGIIRLNISSCSV